MKYSLHYLIAAVVLISVNFSARANGDPVIRFSSLLSVANPEPLSISEIIIDRETMNISHVDGYNCFDVTYTLKNKSDKDFPEIDYGFPIDYCIEDEAETVSFIAPGYGESLYEMGWNENLIKDISFTFNGTPLDFHASKESVREAGYTVESYDGYVDSLFNEGINRRWFYTQFSMKPKSKATLNVRYKVYAPATKSLYGGIRGVNYYIDSYGIPPSSLERYATGSFNIVYDFSPAKHFGKGEHFPIEISIDLSNLDDSWIRNGIDSIAGPTWYHADSVRMYFYFNPEKTKPLNLYCSYNPVRTIEKFNEVISRFIIPESEYVTEERKGSVTYRFNEPRLISDFVCNVDTVTTSAIKTIITYADGTTYETDFKREFYYPTNDGFPAFISIMNLLEQLYYEVYPNPDNPREKKVKKLIRSITLSAEPKAENVVPGVPANVRFLYVKPTL